MLHELWEDPEDDSFTFCPAGRGGDSVRALLSPGATLVWTVEAESYDEAMRRHHEHQGWEPYSPLLG